MAANQTSGRMGQSKSSHELDNCKNSVPAKVEATCCSLLGSGFSPYTQSPLESTSDTVFNWVIWGGVGLVHSCHFQKAFHESALEFGTLVKTDSPGKAMYTENVIPLAVGYTVCFTDLL